MTQAKKAPEVACPRCRKKTRYCSQNQYRPFCSRLCQLEDLGKWAEEEYSIATTEKEHNEH